jgi:hypothetical protein
VCVSISLTVQVFVCLTIYLSLSIRYAGLATPWVTQLNLSDNGLQGTISSALMGLKRMVSLDLSKNRLKGDFVPVVFLGGELRCEDVGGTTRDDMVIYLKHVSTYLRRAYGML